MVPTQHLEKPNGEVIIGIVMIKTNSTSQKEKDRVTERQIFISHSRSNKGVVCKIKTK